MVETNKCPYIIRNLNNDEDCLIKKYYARYQNEYIRVGECGCLLPALYLHHAGAIRHLPLRPTDIFVVAFPRSGTTWTQELVWLLANDLDFVAAKTVPFNIRGPFLENRAFQNPALADHILKTSNYNTEVVQRFEGIQRPVTELLAEMPSPRLIRTHLPISLLPAGALDTAKIVYVARDPRDVMVSSYFFYRSNMTVGLRGEFKEYFDLFIKGLTPWGPYFEHITEAWSQRHHPNMLFLFYEELSKDLASSARRVARFLGKGYSEQQLQELCQFLSFDNFQKSEAINLSIMKYVFKDFSNSNQNNFIRKGKAGGWREYFDEDMSRAAELWMEENMKHTDLSFPDYK